MKNKPASRDQIKRIKGTFKLPDYLKEQGRFKKMEKRLKKIMSTIKRKRGKRHKHKPFASH